MPQQHTAAPAAALTAPSLPEIAATGGGMSLAASVHLAGIGVSVIDANPTELLYLTIGDIAFDYIRENQVQPAVAVNMGITDGNSNFWG